MSDAPRQPLTAWEKVNGLLALLGGLIVLATLPLGAVLSDQQIRVVFAADVAFVYLGALSILTTRAYGCLEIMVPWLATLQVLVAWLADRDNTGPVIFTALVVGFVLWVAAHLLTRGRRRSA